MIHCEYYYEEDVFRIVTLDDVMGYVFKFNQREDLLRMADGNGEGEAAEDHEIYTDSYDEICFLFPSSEPPAWPVIAQYL